MIDQQQILDSNLANLELHNVQLETLGTTLARKDLSIDHLIQKIGAFQVAIPSWALGAGGTRFGRFSYGGEPSTLEEKIMDVGLLHQLTGSAGSISLHIPWDIPSDPFAIRDLAAEYHIAFDAVNSNTFQDQENQSWSYKFGSLSNESEAIREKAIAHNMEVIEIGKKLGSKSITVWLADGSSFPGQSSFRRTLQHTESALQKIYQFLPSDWRMFIEYKPFEPYFYHTVIQDWGTAYLLASACGERAYTLVDLGHHLPNTNIENIVSTLLFKGKLGGFHFNDSKYGDDDLTVGSIKPYQLFLIFNELICGMMNNTSGNPPLAWMIDASHNLKDPLEDLIQSLDAILIAYAQALIVDQESLKSAQLDHDVALCQEILQDAYRTDVRPLIREARKRNNAAVNPLQTYRELSVRNQLIQKRGLNAKATGL